MNRLIALFILTTTLLSTARVLAQMPSSMPDTAYARLHDLAQITFLDSKDTLSHYAFDQQFHLIEEIKDGQHQHWTYIDDWVQSHRRVSDGREFLSTYDAEGIEIYYRSDDGRNVTQKYVEPQLQIKYEETVSPDACSYHLWDAQDRLAYRVYEQESGAWDIQVFRHENDQEIKWEITRNADLDTVLVERFHSNYPTLLLDSINGKFMLHEGNGSTFSHYNWDTKKGTSSFHIRHPLFQNNEELNEKKELRKYRYDFTEEEEREYETVVDSLGKLIRLKSELRIKNEYMYYTRESFDYDRSRGNEALRHEVFDEYGKTLWKKHRDADSTITLRQKTSYFKWGKYKDILKKQVTRKKGDKNERTRSYRYHPGRLKFWKKPVQHEMMENWCHHRTIDCMPRERHMAEPLGHIFLDDVVWANTELKNESQTTTGILFSKDTTHFDHQALAMMIANITYPPIAREAGIEGMLAVAINGDDVVRDFEILRSPHPILEKAALKELEKLRGATFESGPSKKIKVVKRTHSGRKIQDYLDINSDLVILIRFRLD